MRTYGTAAFLLVLLSAPLAQAQRQSGPPGAVAPSGTVWRSNSARAADYNSALEYGLKADGYTAADGSIASGSNVFSSSSKNCAAGDAGKVLTVSGAGAVDGNGALDPLVTTVTGCSGNSFLLAANATTTQSGVSWAYGTDNSAALKAAIAASPRGVVRLPPGGILLNAQSATLNNVSLECVKTPNFDSDNFSTAPKQGTTIMLTSLSTVPFWATSAWRVSGCNFYWPGQTGISRQGAAAPPYPAQPTLAAGSGGSLSAGTYYGEVTYLASGVESPPSKEIPIAVSASGTLTATLPSKKPSNADHWNLYVGISSGSEELQNPSPIAIGTASDAISSLTTGTGAPPPPFVPVAFPPLLESNGSLGLSGIVNAVFDGNTVVNAYDAVVQCNGSGDPAASCLGDDGGGNNRFLDDNIYAVHAVFQLNNISETTTISGVLSNPSIFTQPGWNGGIAGNLADWTAENGAWMAVEGNGTGSTCSTRPAQFYGRGLTVETYHWGVHVTSGALNEASIDHASTFAAEIPVEVDAAGALQSDNFDARWVATTNGNSQAPNASAFQYLSTCGPFSNPGFMLGGFAEQAEGTFLDIEGSQAVTVKLSGMLAFGIGNSATAGTYYFAKVNNSNAILRLDGNYAQAGPAAGNAAEGVLVAAAARADITGNVFKGFNADIDTTGAGSSPVYVSANSAAGTAGSNSVIGNGSATYLGTNSFDKPPLTAAVAAFYNNGVNFAVGNAGQAESDNYNTYSGGNWNAGSGATGGFAFAQGGNGTVLTLGGKGAAGNADSLLIDAASAGGTPTIYAQGSDTNIGINLAPKGSGVLEFEGTAGVSCSGSPTASFATSGGLVTHC